MRIDWAKVWREFDAWLKSREKRCDKCGDIDYGQEWCDQQKAIQRIVNKQLKAEGSSH